MKLDLLAAIGPKPLELSTSERDAILEIAYLTIAADRVLAEEEEIAFRGIAGLLAGRSTPLSSEEAARIVEYLRKERTREEADERLRQLAKALPASTDARQLRQLAYKVAYALAMSDLATGDEEFEFDLQLIDALEITPQQADDLANEVMGALIEPEPAA